MTELTDPNGAPIMRNVYASIASAIDARLTCLKTGNPFASRHEDIIHHICREHLPRGSGIDSGCYVDLDRSTGEHIVITFGYHCMNENGYYDGWIHYTVHVRASLFLGLSLRITGRDYNGIKEYFYDLFQ